MLKLFEKTDAQIRHDVITEIKWDPSVNSSQVGVSVQHGIITLRGSVPHYFEKSQVENATQRVSGVRAIVNEIEIDLMGSYLRSDEQIAEAALNAFQWSYSAPKEIKVIVEKGWVTLKGIADWDFQRLTAEKTVSQLMGVCGVTNDISIRSKTQPADIKGRIEEALKRSAESEGRKITVSVEGNRAILEGKVHSFGEFAEAAHAAWMAPGITTVENKLQITQ